MEYQRLYMNVQDARDTETALVKVLSLGCQLKSKSFT